MLNASLRKYTGYSFWVTLEVVLFIGLPRLIIFPVAAYILGKEQFGLFVFSLGIVMMELITKMVAVDYAGLICSGKTTMTE